MDKTTAVAVLQNALERCRKEDMRTAEVLAALTWLAIDASEQWPFDQFRKALDNRGSNFREIEGHWQVLNASLNGIRRVVR